MLLRVVAECESLALAVSPSSCLHHGAPLRQPVLEAPEHPPGGALGREREVVAGAECQGQLGRQGGQVLQGWW